MDEIAQRLIEQSILTPYFHLDGYIQRYWLTPNPKDDPTQTLSARLHLIERADLEEHMHDHPAGNISVILDNGYVERMPKSQDQDPALDATEYVDHIRKPGDLVHRKATDRHKIVSLLDPSKPAITVFVMSQWQQDWGFYTPTGKVHWREYLNDWGLDPAPGHFVGNYRPANPAADERPAVPAERAAEPALTLSAREFLYPEVEDFEAVPRKAD